MILWKMVSILEFLLESSGAYGLRPPNRPSCDTFPPCTGVTHILAELLIADEPVDTQEILLLAFPLERIRDVVLVIPWLLSVTVPVGWPFPYAIIGNGEEIHGVLDKFLVLLRSVSQEVPARAIDDADVPI